MLLDETKWINRRPNQRVLEGDGVLHFCLKRQDTET